MNYLKYGIVELLVYSVTVALYEAVLQSLLGIVDGNRLSVPTFGAIGYSCLFGNRLLFDIAYLWGNRLLVYRCLPLWQ